MKPTLNQADIKLLKDIFATKEDLGAMEKRMGEKFVTKDDINSRFDELESILVKNFGEIEKRLTGVEDELGLEPAN